MVVDGPLRQPFSDYMKNTEAFGLRLLGLGFWGFGVWGLGFRDLGFGVWGFGVCGLRLLGLGVPFPGTGPGNEGRGF